MRGFTPEVTYINTYTYTHTYIHSYVHVRITSLTIIIHMCGTSTFK